MFGPTNIDSVCKRVLLEERDGARLMVTTMPTKRTLIEPKEGDKRPLAFACNPLTGFGFSALFLVWWMLGLYVL